MGEIAIKRLPLEMQLMSLGSGFANDGNNLRTGAYNSTISSVVNQFDVIDLMIHSMSQYHSNLRSDIENCVRIVQKFEAQDEVLGRNIRNAVTGAAALIEINLVTAGGGM